MLLFNLLFGMEPSKILLFLLFECLLQATLASMRNQTTDITYATKKDPHPLVCQDDRDESYTWFYQASSLDLIEIISGAKNYTYMIESSDQTGVYNCSLEGSNVISMFHAVNLTLPNIIHSGKSLVHTDGDVNKTIQCISYSYPSAKFIWTFTSPDGKVIDLNTANNSVFHINNSILHHSTLLISSITEEMRGTYSCIAKRSLSNANATASVYLRVHGKLAALWPFLGIICEVGLIVGIIFVVRKRGEGIEKEPFGQTSTGSWRGGKTEEVTAVRYRKGVRN